MAMEVSNVLVFDNVLVDPDQYVKEILATPFIDVEDGEKVFRGIQLMPLGEITRCIHSFSAAGNDLEVVHNFVRRSPESQQEPNLIHSDREMCDTIAILYLNKESPQGAGTTIYENKTTGSLIDFGDKEYNKDNFKESFKIAMKYNRMIVFPSDLYHSRSIEQNFGSGDNSRLVQVVLLKRKQWR